MFLMQHEPHITLTDDDRKQDRERFARWTKDNIQSPTGAFLSKAFLGVLGGLVLGYLIYESGHQVNVSWNGETVTTVNRFTGAVTICKLARNPATGATKKVCY